MDRCCVEIMSLQIVSYCHSAHMVTVEFRTSMTEGSTSADLLQSQSMSRERPQH